MISPPTLRFWWSSLSLSLVVKCSGLVHVISVGLAAVCQCPTCAGVPKLTQYRKHSLTSAEQRRIITPESTLANTAQYVVGCLWRKGTLLAHIEFVFHQNAQVLFCKITFYPVQGVEKLPVCGQDKWRWLKYRFLNCCFCLGLSCTSCRTSISSFFNSISFSQPIFPACQCPFE